MKSNIILVTVTITSEFIHIFGGEIQNEANNTLYKRSRGHRVHLASYKKVVYFIKMSELDEH